MNSPLNRILNRWQKPLFTAKTDELAAARQTLGAIQANLKLLHGARLGKLSTRQTNALNELEGLLSSNARRTIFTDDNWHAEMSRLAAEANQVLAGEENRRTITLDILREAAWTVKIRFTIDSVSSGLQPFLRDSSDRCPPGLDSRLIRAAARRCLPVEARLRDVEVELTGAAPDWAAAAQSYSGSVGLNKELPGLLRVSYCIRNEQNPHSFFCAHMFIQVGGETPTDTLLREWQGVPDGFLQTLGKAIASNVRLVPWRSLEDLGKAIEDYSGGATHLLAELGLYRRRELELLNGGKCMYGLLEQKLPKLVAGSPWPTIRKYALPIASAVQCNPDSAAAVLQSVLAAARATGQPDLFAVDAYLAEAAGVLAAGSASAEFARAVLSFFALSSWNTELSDVFRFLVEQVAGATARGLGVEHQTVLVRNGSQCLTQAAVQGNLRRAIFQLAPLIKLDILSGSTKAELRHAAAETTGHLLGTESLQTARLGTWITATEITEFLSALDALKTLDGPWRFETWDSWTSQLPQRDDRFLRCPASLAPLAQAWLTRPEDPSSWPLLTYLKDLAGWLVSCRFLSSFTPSPVRSGTLQQLLENVALNPEDQAIARLAALTVVCDRVEQCNGVSDSVKAALNWITDASPDLWEATTTVAAMSPWQEPKLRLAWQQWFLNAWNGSSNKWRPPLVNLTLNAWAASPKRRTDWTGVLLKCCPAHLTSEDAGGGDIAIRKFAAALTLVTAGAETREFLIQGLSAWLGRERLFAAISRFCEEVGRKIVPDREKRLPLLMGALSDELVRSALPAFLIQHPEAMDLSENISMLSDILACVKGEMSLLDGVLIQHLQQHSKTAPLEAWRRLQAVKLLLGKHGLEMLPQMYRNLAQGLLKLWLAQGDQNAIGLFAAECGNALDSLGPALVSPLAGEFLVKTQGDWQKLRDKALLLIETFRKLGLNESYDAARIQKIITGPPLPPDTGLLLLTSLFCVPKIVAQNMMEDLAWQAATVQRFTSRTMGSYLASIALNEKI